MQDDRIVPSEISEETPDKKLEDGPLKQRHRKIAAGVVAACSVALIGVSAFFLVPAMSQISAEDVLQTTSDQASKVASNKEAVSSEGKTASSKESVVDSDEGVKVSGSDSGGSGSVSSGPDGSSQSSDSSTYSSESGQASENNVVTVSVSISSSVVGNPVSGGTTVSFAKGATVYDALMACGLSVNAVNSPTGIYVSAMGGLAATENGPESGWKYSVNGIDPPESCSNYILNDGDVVSWRYVLSANG